MGAPRLARTMSVRFAATLAIALAASWAIAGSAAALEPGVFVDPGSPAGKEYGVPLSELRGAASGHAPVGNQSPPLFGIGISSHGGRGGVSPSATRGGGSRHSRRAHTAGRRRAASSRAAGAGAAGAGPALGPALAQITRHGSAVPAVALIGALVVLGGLGVGGLLAAARRRVQ